MAERALKDAFLHRRPPLPGRVPRRLARSPATRWTHSAKAGTSPVPPQSVAQESQQIPAVMPDRRSAILNNYRSGAHCGVVMHKYSTRFLARVCLMVLLAASSVAWAQPTGKSFPDEWFYDGDKRPAPLKALEGKPAAALSIASWIGNEVTNSGSRGKVVVVDFWAHLVPPMHGLAPTQRRTRQEVRRPRSSSSSASTILPTGGTRLLKSSRTKASTIPSAWTSQVAPRSKTTGSSSGRPMSPSTARAVDAGGPGSCPTR